VVGRKGQTTARWMVADQGKKFDLEEAVLSGKKIYTFIKK
jgi:hypothetical protein